MSAKKDSATFLSSRLYTEASEKLEEETEKEKKVEDPSAEEATAALEDAEINSHENT